jgi:DNA (cytosine-5)-methyltransferase 3A
MINASLVSAQQRKRLFWTNIEVIEQPKDRNIYLKDVLEKGGFTEKMKSYALTATYSSACPRDYFLKSSRQLIFNKPVRVRQLNKGGQGDRVYSIDGKSVCLSANGGGRGAKTGLYKIKDHVRKLTPIECERLQGLPDNYTKGVSNTQRYKCLGNAFNVDVVAHILKNINLKK